MIPHVHVFTSLRANRNPSRLPTVTQGRCAVYSDVSKPPVTEAIKSNLRCEITREFTIERRKKTLKIMVSPRCLISTWPVPVGLSGWMGCRVMVCMYG